MKKRLLSLGMALCMVLTVVPISAFAEENSEVQTCICEVVCTEETRNTDCPVCGVEGAALEDCGKYVVPMIEMPTEETNTEVTVETEVPTETEPEQTAVEKVQTLINALPDADTITEENRADVEDQLTAIDDAKLPLTDEERDTLDFGKYNAAIAKLNELDDMSGAEIPAVAAEPTDESYFKFDATTGTITGLTDNSLAEIVIPDTIGGVAVKIIGENAFENYSEIQSITIPDGVTSIGDYAFSSCGGLTNITIPDSVTSIGKEAFFECYSLTSIIIPSGVTSIQRCTFEGCSALTDVTISNGVISIGERVFGRCYKLKSITIPNSVIFIGEGAFVSTGLTSITIPNSVTSIAYNTFSDATSLTCINVSDDNKVYSSMDGVLFNKDQTKIVKVPEGRSGEYTIPNGVNTIGEYALNNCRDITGITIPNSVKTIESNAFAHNKSFASITIPDGVEKIGRYAFYGCGFSSIILPNTVTAIDYGAFYDDLNVANAYYLGTKEEWETLKSYIGGANDSLTKNVRLVPVSYTVADTFVYDGKQKTGATVSKKDNALGDITIRYYQGTGEASPVNAGTYTVKLDVAASAKYEAVTGFEIGTFTITKATPNLTAPTAQKSITYGATLSTAGLPDGWTWVDGSTVPTVTNSGYTAYYTPADTANYNWTAIDGWNASENRVERTVAVTVNKAEQNAPSGLDYKAETVDKKADGYIKNLTTAMEYRKNEETTYTSISGTELTNLLDGTYYIRYKEDNNHNASKETTIVLSNDTKLKVTVPTTQEGYTLTVDKTELAWNENVTLTFKLKEGYSKIDAFAVNVNRNPVTLNNDGKFTVNNAQEDITVTVVGVADNTAPTGEIKISDNSWKSFLNSITFGLFFKDTQTVTITAEDKGSGVDKIYYYISENALSELEVAALEDDKWTPYDENNKPSISPDKKCIVYVKTIDKVQNVGYISSNGLVLDSIEPVISGIKNGETYCSAQTVTVTEKYVDTVTVNGNPITLDTNGKFTLTPAEGTQTVVITDKAGNSASITVTVNNGHTGGTATCTNKAICKVCSEPYGEVDSDNHVTLTHVTKKAATVDMLGNIEYWHCEGCGKLFADADGKNEIESIEETYLYAVIFDTDGGSTIVSKSNVKWQDDVLNGVTDPTKGGYKFVGWKCGTTDVTTDTKYKDLAANKSTASIELTAQWTDTTAPTGEIKISDNSWRSFLNNITFGLFFKDTQQVTITATDNSGEDVKIEYLLSDKELTVEELATKTFTAYTDKFNIEPDNEYVIYAKLTDKTGNVAYINSNGIVLDSIEPVISGIKNGETYCSAQTVTVTEKYVDTVTVNGNPITLDADGKFTLSPAEGIQTVVITDKAGNSTSVTVTVNNGHTGGTATCKDKAKCEVCGTPYGEVNATNHTALKHIEAKAATTEAEGNIEYWHCEDCGKYFSDKDGKNVIDLKDTVIKKLPPEIIDGKGQSLIVGEKKELSFRSNAAYSDFIRVEVDGKTVDKKNYTVKEGSTIVTLEADYVAALSVGEHKFSIVSESGTATTTFTVNAKAVNNKTSPITGDNSHMTLWLSLLFIGVLVGTVVYGKKRRCSAK